jgi:hypothetical protein
MLTVEAAHRIRVPREIADVVSWLDAKGDGIECVGLPGPAGGMQIQPLGAHDDEVRRITDALGGVPPSFSDADQKWMDTSRLLATVWALTIRFESTRFSLTVPEPPRRAQILPQPGGMVVVFGFGEILEIWDAAKWHEHVRAVAKRKGAALAEALEDMGQR